jgi:hypothetical protein
MQSYGYFRRFSGLARRRERNSFTDARRIALRYVARLERFNNVYKVRG